MGFKPRVLARWNLTPGAVNCREVLVFCILKGTEYTLHGIRGMLSRYLIDCRQDRPQSCVKTTEPFLLTLPLTPKLGARSGALLLL